MQHKIAYFSMEIALDPTLQTYSGGLGVLAGDTLRGAADLRAPMVGVTLLHRKGYFRQHVDSLGNQSESSEVYQGGEMLQLLEPIVSVTVEGRKVAIRAWRFVIQGGSGHEVPVYLLDTDTAENSNWDRSLTDSLYGGDDRYRLCQEIVLGMGGVAMLRALEGHNLDIYHMNEGHSALLALALLREQMNEAGSCTPTEQDIQMVRRKCVFTTHTPVPAGHDQFSWDLVRQAVGQEQEEVLVASNCCLNRSLNMTFLALRFSHYVNGVAMKHGEISRGMFPTYSINAITNGVHAATWIAPAFRELYNRYIAQWRQDNLYLRYAISIPLHEILAAHSAAKRAMLDNLQTRSGERLQETALTIGFARRATEYKRLDFLFSDLERLRSIARNVGPLQVICGGKAHPRDEGGKAVIRRVFEAAEALRGIIPVIYVENYDLRWGQLLTSGVDLWLNTPQRPQEASGTSGMKAALNGVPSFSVLDGWWIEGHIEGVTGWAIGGRDSAEPASVELSSLYEKLERVIAPLYYGHAERYAEVMRSAIALNGSFFNTQRMVSQYLTNAYQIRAESETSEYVVVDKV